MTALPGLRQALTHIGQVLAATTATTAAGLALGHLRAAAAWLARPWRRVTAAHTGRHCPMTPAPESAPVQAPRPGDPPSADGEVRAGATPQAPAPNPRTGQDEAAPLCDLPDGAANTVPLRAVAPPPPQGHPYAGWPQPPLGALVVIRDDGAVEYRRPDGIITVRALPGGGTSTEVWTPRRRQPDTVAWLDLRVVPRWYEAWLAEHPEAEVTAA